MGEYDRHFGMPRQFRTLRDTINQDRDLVRAVVPSGKKVATHLGRVAVRASASFNITTRADTIQGISYRYCTLVQRVDSYIYQFSLKGA